MFATPTPAGTAPTHPLKFLFTVLHSTHLGIVFSICILLRWAAKWLVRQNLYSFVAGVKLVGPPPWKMMGNTIGSKMVVFGTKGQVCYDSTPIRRCFNIMLPTPSDPPSEDAQNCPPPPISAQSPLPHIESDLPLTATDKPPVHFV